MDYSITNPKTTIKQPNAEQTIEQPEAKLEIKTTDAVINIDMTKFYSDVGLKRNSELMSDFVNKARQEMMSSISRRVNEGRQIMIGSGKNQGVETIKSIAIQNHGPKRSGPIGLDFIPSYNSIKVNIEPGTTEVNIERQNPKIEVKVNKPQIDFTYGKVSGKMLVRPDVTIDVTG